MNLKKERYYRLKVKALYEAKRSKECVDTANNALSLSLKWHFNTLQWINYQRACSLVELEQYDEAKKVFLSLHNRIRNVNSTKFFIKLMLKQATLKKQMLIYYMNFFENGYSINHLGIYITLDGGYTTY